MLSVIGLCNAAFNLAAFENSPNDKLLITCLKLSLSAGILDIRSNIN